jgi:hypothetical protein
LLRRDEVVRLDDAEYRGHSIVDLLVLLATVCLALATWAYLDDIPSVPPWKAFVSVAITVLLALAALTRNPDWAMAIRFLTGGWLIAAPFVLRFDQVALELPGNRHPGCDGGNARHRRAPWRPSRRRGVIKIAAAVSPPLRPGWQPGLISRS